MMRYIKVGRHSGDIISAARKGNFVGITTNTTKTLVKLDRNYSIDDHKVYDIRITDGVANITVIANAWACSKQTYDTIMHDGNEIINRMFGDLMK